MDSTGDPLKATDNVLDHAMSRKQSHFLILHPPDHSRHNQPHKLTETHAQKGSLPHIHDRHPKQNPQTPALSNTASCPTKTSRTLPGSNRARQYPNGNNNFSLALITQSSIFNRSSSNYKQQDASITHRYLRPRLGQISLLSEIMKSGRW